MGNLSRAVYWIMGFVGALGLFGSIIFHELSHSLVARRFGMPIRGITLWIFGGVAHMEDNPPSPKAEFAMAIAGPLSSFLLAGVFLGLHRLSGSGSSGSLFAGGGSDISTPVQGVLWYIGRINLILGLFNLLPAFPLDGGRVLRAALWRGLNDIIRATRAASIVGSAFGFILIGAGIFSLFTGSFIGSIWWVLIGLFLHSASQNGYRQLLFVQALSGVPVKKFMKKNPVTVSGNDTVARLVEDYVYTHHYKMYPVEDNGSLDGCVTTEDIKSVDRENWDTTAVREIKKTCSEENALDPETDCTVALKRMQKTGNSRLMVAKDGKLLGVVTLKDLIDFLSLKLDLEPEQISKDVKKR
jgi:Zn-dependent protease/predicted transcriptional regulator